MRVSGREARESLRRRRSGKAPANRKAQRVDLRLGARGPARLARKGITAEGSRLASLVGPRVLVAVVEVSVFEVACYGVVVGIEAGRAVFTWMRSRSRGCVR
jgi:hypothetical protein